MWEFIYPNKLQIKNLRAAKIIFPIFVTVLVAIIVPSAVSLIGMLMFGNLIKEIGSDTSRIADTASNALMNIATIFLGLSVGATMTVQSFLNWQTIGLALEFAEAGVRVNCICPGNLLNSPLWVNSLFKQYAANQGITEEQVREKYINQVPMKRSCEYKDIEDVMVFLASDYSSYMTGQAINVTGGQQM